MNEPAKNRVTDLVRRNSELRASCKALGKRLREVEAERDKLVALILHETSEDEEGEMPHTPREALYILCQAAKSIKKAAALEVKP